LVRTNVIEDMKNKAGVIPKYYTVKGANVGIDASDSISPPDECHYEEVLKENSSGGWYTETIQVCKDYTFGVTLEEKDKNILLPDFGLGFMIRKIHKNCAILLVKPTTTFYLVIASKTCSLDAVAAIPRAQLKVFVMASL
jgi:hypothetical protein